MSLKNTISMQGVRRDLPGFLDRIAGGQKITVIYRSAPLVTVQSSDYVEKAKPDADQNIQDFLAIAAEARKQAKNQLDPKKSYKQLYAESEADKHGIS